MRNTIILLSLIFGMTACTQEEVDNKPLINGEELNISAGITISLPAEQAPATRTGEALQGETTAFTDRDFSLIVKDNRTDKGNVSLATSEAKTDKTLTGNTNYDEVGNVAKVDPALAALAPKLYWDDLGGKQADLNLVGIYPATANPGIKTDIIVWKVRTDQSKGTDASDLMLAYRPAYTYANKSIAANLNFNHVMAKITVNLIKGENYGDGGFTDPVLVLTNLPENGKINLVPDADKSYTITDKQNANIIPTTPVLIEGTTSYTSTALVVPTTLEAGTIIATVAVDNNKYNVTLKAETEIVAGGNNVINVTVNKSEASVSATITGWTLNELPEMNSQLVEIEVLPIKDTKITEGSTLLVTIKDAKDKAHTVKYIATLKAEDNKLYWKVSGTPLYWDNIAFPASGAKLTANALLRVGGDTSADICTGSYTEITTAQSKLELALTRQMSKVTIKLKTTTGDDKVIFTDKDIVTLPTYYGYTVTGTTLTKNTTTANLPVLFSVKEDDGATWVYETIIIPQMIDKTKNIITIKIGDNTYNVPVSTTGKDETFAAAEHYTYTIRIKKIGLDASATITDWNTIAKPDIDTDLDN